MPRDKMTRSTQRLVVGAGKMFRLYSTTTARGRRRLCALSGRLVLRLCLGTARLALVCVWRGRDNAMEFPDVVDRGVVLSIAVRLSRATDEGVVHSAEHGSSPMRTNAAVILFLSFLAARRAASHDTSIPGVLVAQRRCCKQHDGMNPHVHSIAQCGKMGRVKRDPSQTVTRT